MKNLNLIKQYFTEIIQLSNTKKWISALALPLLMVGTLLFTSKSSLQNLDQKLSPYLMLLALVVTLIYIPQLLLKLKQALKNFPIPKIHFLFLLLTVLSASYLAINHIEAQHRVQSDESIFLSTAQNIFHEQIAATCDEGYFDTNLKLDCKRSATSFKTKILSLVYAVGMPIFGKSLTWIFKLQFAFYIGSLLLLFLGIHLWLKNLFLAQITTALFAFIPTILFQFRSASVEPLYVVLAFLALVQCYFIYNPEPVQSIFSKPIFRTIEWLALASTLAMLSQTRQESIFCTGAFMALVVKRALSEKNNLSLFSHSFAIFVLPVPFLILSFQGYNFQGGEYQAHGLANLINHIKINFEQMTLPLEANGLLTNPFLAWFTYLSLFGLIALTVHAFFNKKAFYIFCFLTLYHIQSIVIFENVSGDFTIHINQRYSLVILPTMAFLSGYFIYLIHKLAIKFYQIKNNYFKDYLPTLAGILIIAFLSYKHIPSFENNVMFNRNHLTTEEKTILNWIDKNPGRHLFLYDRPWHFIGYAHSSISYQAWNALSPQKQTLLEKDYQGNIFYVRGLRCYGKNSFHKKAVESRSPEWCENFEKNHSLELLLDTNVTNSYPLQISRVRVGRNPQLDQPLLAFDHWVNNDSIHFSFNWNPIWEGFNRLFNHRQKSSRFLDKSDGIASYKLEKGINSFELQFTEASTKTKKTPIYYEYFYKNAEAKSLTEMNPYGTTQSWGQLKLNRSTENNPLKVGGISFEKGFGVHAYSYNAFKIPPGFSEFEFGIGLDDEDKGGDGVIFRVIGDAKVLFKSDKVIPLARQWNKIDIRGITTLELIVDSLKNKDYDHADWLEPTLWK